MTEENLDDNLKRAQLKFMLRRYAKGWFSLKSLRMMIVREGVENSVFGNVPEKRRPFARYLERLIHDGWLETAEDKYRLSLKSMELLGVNEELEFGVNIKEALIFLISEYGEKMFSYQSLSLRLRKRAKNPFAIVSDNRDMFKKFLNRLVDEGYLGMVSGNFMLMNEAYIYAKGEPSPSFEKAAKYTKEELVEILMQALYKEVRLKNFTIVVFVRVINRLVNDKAFSGAWKVQIGNVKRSEIGDLLLAEGYIIPKGKARGKTSYAINPEKWMPEEKK